MAEAAPKSAPTPYSERWKLHPRDVVLNFFEERPGAGVVHKPWNPAWDVEFEDPSDSKLGLEAPVEDDSVPRTLRRIVTSEWRDCVRFTDPEFKAYRKTSLQDPGLKRISRCQEITESAPYHRYFDPHDSVPYYGRSVLSFYQRSGRYGTLHCYETDVDAKPDIGPMKDDLAIRQLTAKERYSYGSLEDKAFLGTHKYTIVIHDLPPSLHRRSEAPWQNAVYLCRETPIEFAVAKLRQLQKRLVERATTSRQTMYLANEPPVTPILGSRGSWAFGPAFTETGEVFPNLTPAPLPVPTRHELESYLNPPSSYYPVARVARVAREYDLPVFWKHRVTGKLNLERLSGLPREMTRPVGPPVDPRLMSLNELRQQHEPWVFHEQQGDPWTFRCTAASSGYMISPVRRDYWPQADTPLERELRATAEAEYLSRRITKPQPPLHPDELDAAEADSVPDLAPASAPATAPDSDEDWISKMMEWLRDTDLVAWARSDDPQLPPLPPYATAPIHTPMPAIETLLDLEPPRHAPVDKTYMSLDSTD